MKKIIFILFVNFINKTIWTEGVLQIQKFAAKSSIRELRLEKQGQLARPL